jgi:glutamine phosphoribosylpyrophosphate amidotransferase
LESFSGVSHFSTIGAYARFLVSGDTDLKRLTDAIESLDKDFEVVSMGHRLEIVKQTGSPDNLEKTYCVSRMKGTHGIGHTRLSTESRVDLSHSQPFWSHGCPDLAIVHNGHITNYHQLRRRYEQHGVRFYTENDSEVVAIYLAEQITKGASLQQALERMLRDLDGSYSCLAATERELGFVKDTFALKPLVMTETNEFVAVATEEIAIRAALPGQYSVREAQVREVRVWQR